MKFKEKIKAYAKLVMVKGLNIKKGDILEINIPVERADFAKVLCQTAYEMGAKKVFIDYRDTDLSKLDYTYQDEESLAEVPQYLIDKSELKIKEKWKRLSVTGEDPYAFENIDKNKIKIRNMAVSKAMKDYYDKMMANYISWCVIGAPVLKWGKAVFPQYENNVVIERLWDLIFKTARVLEGDPIENWNEHIKTLKNRAKYMTKSKFKELHYKSKLGTDLRVKLPENYIFEGAEEINKDGQKFVANIPTEEIFSLPHRQGVDGIVYATKPLNHNGSLVKDFWFKFKDGQVVEYGAKEGKEVLENILTADEGAKRLGEVALVPYHSPISQTGVLFYNTLYDENASCHFALGAAYPSCLEGSENMSEEELLQKGVNDSLVHVDFMVGDESTEIVGIKENGEEVEIFKNGDFVI